DSKQPQRPPTTRRWPPPSIHTSGSYAPPISPGKCDATLDAQAGVERQGSGHERGHGGGLLVGVDLGVGDPAVIVDDGVADVIADSFALLRAGAGPIA